MSHFPEYGPHGPPPQDSLAGEVTFTHEATLHIKCRVVYGKPVEVVALHILPHQKEINSVWDGPVLPDDHVVLVRLGLHGDHPDEFIEAARALGMKVTITRLEDEMGVPEVEIAGMCGKLVAFLGDRYVGDTTEAERWIDELVVMDAKRFLNEETWPILGGLPDNIVWEG